jgi:hypothetical protein
MEQDYQPRLSLFLKKLFYFLKFNNSEICLVIYTAAYPYFAFTLH